MEFTKKKMNMKGYVTIITLALMHISVAAFSQQGLSLTNASEKAFSPASSSSFAASLISPKGSVEVIGSPSVITDKAGNAHLFYVDKISGNQLVLRYVRKNGAAWESSEVDKLGNATQNDGRLGRGLNNQIPSVAMGGDGVLHYAYLKVEAGKLNLYYANFNPSRGKITKTFIETITSNASKQFGLAVDKQNVVHISYHNEGLKYANNKTGRFVPKMLKTNEDEKPNFVERGVNSTLHVMSNGNILIPYQGTHHRNWAVVAEFIDCQVYANGIWKNIGIVGSLGTMNTNGFYIFESNGTPSLIHYAGGTLGYAQYTGRWSEKTYGLGADQPTSALSATVASSGKPAVAWYSRTAKLYISYRNGETWSSQRVEGVEQYGNTFPAVVPAANGKVNIFVRANAQGKGALVLLVAK